ncbi:MAG: hypothetical protein WA654_15545 [Candidatus Sulfotelmatobacter sp.]
MKTRVAFGLLTILLLVSCSSTPRTSLATPTSRVYHGTASVGDFMTVTVNSGAQTIAYTDLSNGASGAVSYTVNSNGGYTLSDPTGNLVAAYEVPNYAMVIQATKTGPSANTLALVTAVESGQISLATFEGQAYNYMQFRTASGGVDVGSVNINAQGTGTTSSYWPFGRSTAITIPLSTQTLSTWLRQCSIPPARFSPFQTLATAIFPTTCSARQTGSSRSILPTEPFSA